MQRWSFAELLGEEKIYSLEELRFLFSTVWIGHFDHCRNRMPSILSLSLFLFLCQLKLHLAALAGYSAVPDAAHSHTSWCKKIFLKTNGTPTGLSDHHLQMDFLTSDPEMAPRSDYCLDLFDDSLACVRRLPFAFCGLHS